MKHPPFEVDVWSSTYGPRVLDKTGDVVAWMSLSHAHEVHAVAALPDLIAAVRAVVTAQNAPVELSRQRAVELCAIALAKAIPDLPVNNGKAHPRVAELNAKIESGERLTNDERAERQGIIFNHNGTASGFQVL